MADAAARAAKPQTVMAGRWRSPLLIGAFILLLLVATPTFLVLFVGMMPSIVALVVDREPRRYATAAVSAMNAAGVTPFVFEMWFHSHTISGAEALLANPVVLLIMYSAAAFGWLLFAAIPMAYVAFQQMFAFRQVTALRSRQAELVEEWGDGIKATAPAVEKPNGTT